MLVIHWISCRVLRCAAPTRRCSAVVPEGAAWLIFQYRRHRDGGKLPEVRLTTPFKVDVSVRFRRGRSAAGPSKAGDRSVRRACAIRTCWASTGSGQDVHHGGRSYEAVQSPRWILAPNKTLAQQLPASLAIFFPDNAVFRVVLRLLPAAGYALVGHVHRGRTRPSTEEVEKLSHAATSVYCRLALRS